METIVEEEVEETKRSITFDGKGDSNTVVLHAHSQRESTKTHFLKRRSYLADRLDRNSF